MRIGLDRKPLAEAGALKSLTGHRNEARWSVAGVEEATPLVSDSPQEPAVWLPAPSLAEDIKSDYRSIGLTLGTHPLSLLRAKMKRIRCLTSRELWETRTGTKVRAGGLVTLRQRPATAKGTNFLNLEDELGNIQVIVWASLAEAQRRELIGSRLLVVDGRWEMVDGVGNLIANRLHDRSHWLGDLDVRSRSYK